MPPLPGWHFTKNLTLLTLSLLLLPINTLILLAAYTYRLFPCASTANDDDPLEALEPQDRKTVLVTGVNMAKGLSLARMFHRRGHRVVGADAVALSIGSVSEAVDVYRRLPAPGGGRSVNDPYLNTILQIVREEGVDLWVSVSDVNNAVEDAMVKEILEARTGVKAIQFGVREIQMLHEKDTFIAHVKRLGLKTPDTQVVSSKDEAIAFLRKRGGLALQPRGTQYLLKPLAVDDLARFSMPLLPLPSEAATLDRLAAVPFLSSSRYILQEFISGDEYCTHALVIRGRVRAFVACASATVLMHYVALPAESKLSRAMLAFTERLAGERGEGFTGHVSFDFLVRRGDTGEEKDGEVVLYPIECNPRVHTAIVLFNETHGLVDEYLSILSPPAADNTTNTPLTPTNPDQYYWIGQDLISLVIYPLYLCLFAGTQSLRQVIASTRLFIHHASEWKDGTFEIWDPLPWWWLYHVYWPMRFFGYLGEGSWSQLNVSTGKAFKAS